MRKSEFNINQLLAKIYLIALGKITRNHHKLTENQIRILLNHDASLKRLTSRFSPFTDRNTNVIKQIEYMEKYAATVAKHIKDINSYISYDLGHLNVDLYSFMMTTSNYRLSVNADGELIVANKYNQNPFKLYRKAITELNRHLKRVHSPIRIIISAIEHTYDTNNFMNPFNVHAHMLVASIGRPIHLHVDRNGRNQFERTVSRYLTNEPKVTVTPIKNGLTHKNVAINSKTKPSDMNAVTGFIKYILKQQKMPIAKTDDDVNSFKALPTSVQRQWLEASLHSTNGVTLHSHIRYKSFENYISQLGQTSLFDVSKMADTDGMDSHRKFTKHHATTTEVTRRFYGLDRYTGKPLQAHRNQSSHQGRYLIKLDIQRPSIKRRLYRHKVPYTAGSLNDDKTLVTYQNLRPTAKKKHMTHDQQLTLNLNAINTS